VLRSGRVEISGGTLKSMLDYFEKITNEDMCLWQPSTRLKFCKCPKHRSPFVIHVIETSVLL
jgi:hypothetical protein